MSHQRNNQNLARQCQEVSDARDRARRTRVPADFGRYMVLKQALPARLRNRY
jgi:hypothetical protein